MGRNSPVPCVIASNAGVSAGTVGRIMGRSFPRRRDSVTTGVGLAARGVATPRAARPTPECTMSHEGWKQLLDGYPWFRGEGSFPVFPNSEFMPPVRLGLRPYGTHDALEFADDDPWGWPVTEREELLALRPGLKHLARNILDQLVPLGRGDPAHGICGSKLRQNPHWPAELAEHAKALTHERFVLLLPLALSHTQDDKAHVRCTLFGNSEQPPGY